MTRLTNAERIELGLPLDMTTARQEADEEIRNLPCGCHACDEGVQPGHFACELSPAWVLEREREGFMTRHYNGTRWVWENVPV